MHPIERLRAVARARDVDQRMLAREAAIVLGALSDDPFGLVTSCRRLLDRHPGAGVLWWACARLLDAADPRAEARAVVRDLADDDAVLRPLSLDLPEHSTVVVVPDAAGGSELVDRLAMRRGDLVPVEAADPALDLAAVIDAGASLDVDLDVDLDLDPLGLDPDDVLGSLDPDGGPSGSAGPDDLLGTAGGRGLTDPRHPSAGSSGSPGSDDVLGSAGGGGLADPRHPSAGGRDAARTSGSDPLSGPLTTGAGAAPGTGPTIVLVEAGAAGPDRFLGVSGTTEGIAAARARGLPVWLVVGLGARLPGPLFDAAAARAPGCEVVPISAIDRLIEPRSAPCPCPPELLRP